VEVVGGRLDAVVALWPRPFPWAMPPELGGMVVEVVSVLAVE